MKTKSNKNNLKNTEGVALNDKVVGYNQYAGMLLGEYTPFGVTEAFNKLRTNLLYTSLENKCPVVGITSAYAHAGKSVIIANLAISYTQINKKVLLIDGDMRCPVVSKLFMLDKKNNGLSELLVGKDESYNKYVISSVMDNLDIISNGRIPPNPSALLASEKFVKFISHMREKYDYIFIDLPPICEVTDAGVIASIVDGYVFAVRSGITDHRSVTDALDRMNGVKANIIGFVVNDIPAKYLKAGEKYSGKYKYSKYGKYSRYASYAKENSDRQKKNN